jgi:hypothetical protein
LTREFCPEWLPGSEKGYFEKRLLPALGQTDVLTITMGGNDLDLYVADGPPYDPIIILTKVFENPEPLLGLFDKILPLTASSILGSPSQQSAMVRHGWGYPEGASRFDGLSDRIDGAIRAAAYGSAERAASGRKSQENGIAIRSRTTYDKKMIVNRIA